MQKLSISKSGLLSFEWIVLHSLIALIIIAGFASIRQSYVIQCADLVDSFVNIDQHLHYPQMRIRVVLPVVVSTPVIGVNGKVVTYIQEESNMKFEAETAGSKNIDTTASSNNQVIYVDNNL